MKRFHVSSAERCYKEEFSLYIVHEIFIESELHRRPIRPSSQRFAHRGAALPWKWLRGRKAYAASVQEWRAVNVIKPQALGTLVWCSHVFLNVIK